MKTRDQQDSLDFRLIYEAAKSCDENALKGLISRNTSVDVRDHLGLFTPAAKLAAEGFTESANLLADNFNANRSYIAMGYASVGNTQAAETLRKEHLIDLKLLSIGASMHPKKQYAEWLKDHYDLNENWFILGAALGQDAKYSANLVDAVIFEEVNSSASNELTEKATCAQIEGLMLAGLTRDVIRILDQYREADSDLFLRVAIQAAARANDPDTLEKIIVRNGVNNHLLKGYYEVAALGAAQGGHIDFANKLLDKTDRRLELLETVMLAAMTSGHFNESTRKINGIPGLSEKKFLSHELAMRAALLGHHQTIIDALKIGFKPDLACVMAETGDLARTLEIVNATYYTGMSYKPLVRSMDTSEYFQSSQVLQYVLSFIKTNEFVAKLRDEALAIKSNTERSQGGLETDTELELSKRAVAFQKAFFNEFVAIAMQAERVNRFVDRYGFNFEQANVLANGVIKDKKLPDGSVSALDLMSGLIFSGQDYAKISAVFVGFFGLTPDDAQNMMQKYMTRIAKTYIDGRLQRYIDENSWHYAPWRRHGDRCTSTQKAIKDCETRDDVKETLGRQYRMFNGTYKPDKDDSLPKHEQPLDGKSKDGYYDAIDECYHHRFLNK